MKIGQRLYVRDGWISQSYMIPQAEVVDIAYHKNTQVAKAVLLRFSNGVISWFDTMAVKEQ